MLAIFKNRIIIGKLKRLSRSLPLLWKVYWAYWWVRRKYESSRDHALREEIVDFGEFDIPTLDNPMSQLCTANQFFEEDYRFWCKEMGSPPRYARKQWEFVYIMASLKSRGVLFEGSKGVGFGCGSEPLSGVFAKRGCKILATDLSQDVAKEKGWVDTLEHASGLEDLYLACNKILDEKVFFNNVSFKSVDMNEIPEDISGYDFTWSACALEHLGSLDHGINFIVNTTKCLRPRGVAVHTTEFNLSSKEETLESINCSIYREKDIVELAIRLESVGCTLEVLNLNTGDMSVDKYIDVPPFGFSPHLKLILESYVVTSIGLIVTKN